MSAGLVAVSKHVEIGREWAGLTAQEAARKAFGEIGVREAFKKCRTGEILVNSKRCEPLERLVEGDCLTVVLFKPPQPREIPVTASHKLIDTPSGPLYIVREDDDLLAVSKYAGCASHPALRRSGDTLIERVTRYLGSDDDFSPALANRLDIETSGIVLVGKNRISRARLGHDLQRRRVEKFYLALVAGRPESEGEIILSLERKPDSRDLMLYPEGHAKLTPRVQEAHTRYRVIKTAENLLFASLVEVELLTGRTHQIRRHFAMIGHPVAMDRRYGDPVFNHEASEALSLGRMFLHAYKVRLPHPRTRAMIEITAPPPPDLATCLDQLGIEASQTWKDQKS